MVGIKGCWGGVEWGRRSALGIIDLCIIGDEFYYMLIVSLV